MHESCALRGALLVFGVAALAAAAGAEPVPHGNEFMVNSYTSDGQLKPQVGAAGSGSFIVTWASSHDGDFTGVFAQRYDASGSSQGNELQVNTNTSSSQIQPAVAVHADGSFVVMFASDPDGDNFGIFGQRFDSSGARQGVEFQVNTYTPSEQSEPGVAMRSSGEFVVVWISEDQDGSGRGVFGRRFAASGVAQGVEFQVNLTTAGYQGHPALALNDDGSFVVLWQGYDQDGSDQGVFGQRFSSTAARVGVEFQVNSYTTGIQNSPSVAADAGGQFVAVWQSYHDGDYAGVFGQRFGAAGQRLGTEFQVNSHTQSSQGNASVARQAGGAFVVVWDSYRAGTGLDIIGQRFSANGARLGGEFNVNTYQPNGQYYSRVVSNRNGGFVVVWQSRYQDGSDLGVFGQLYLQNLVLDVDGDGSFLPLTDGLLILRYAFGFRGAVLVTGAVGGGCTRCTAEDIEAYLGSI